MMTIDPICKKKVDIELERRYFVEGCTGRTVYFCSEKCKNDFQNDAELINKMCHD